MQALRTSWKPQLPAPKRGNTKMPKNLWKIMDEGGDRKGRKEKKEGNRWWLKGTCINLLGSYN